MYASKYPSNVIENGLSIRLFLSEVILFYFTLKRPLYYLQCGRFSAAHIALRSAEISGLSAEDVLLNECRILMEEGQINKALLLLEPVEPDILRLRAVVKSFIHRAESSQASQQDPSLDNIVGAHGLETEEGRTRFAERLQLATKCMVDSRRKYGTWSNTAHHCIASPFHSLNEQGYSSQ
jgi:hypothetical protein